MIQNTTLNFFRFFQTISDKIIGKTAIWAISCFYHLSPLNNVEKQGAKVASSYVMGWKLVIGGEGDF